MFFKKKEEKKKELTDYQGLYEDLCETKQQLEKENNRLKSQIASANTTIAQNNKQIENLSKQIVKQCKGELLINTLEILGIIPEEEEDEERFHDLLSRRGLVEQQMSRAQSNLNSRSVGAMGVLGGLF